MLLFNVTFFRPNLNAILFAKGNDDTRHDIFHIDFFSQVFEDF